jgi:hypothetical protein
MFKGTRKEGNDQPHERDRNAPNASAIKGTPRPLTLELAQGRRLRNTKSAKLRLLRYQDIQATKPDKAKWQGLNVYCRKGLTY